MGTGPADRIVRRTWYPTLSVVGIAGIPEPQIAGGLGMIARQHTQATRGDGQRLVEAELGGEICHLHGFTRGVLGTLAVGLLEPAGLDHVRLELIENPLHVGRLWQKMYDTDRGIRKKGIPVYAISALDIGLWDILGKSAGKPVCSCLNSSPVSRSGIWQSGR